MTIDSSRAPGPGLAGRATELITGLTTEPWGTVSPSTYETGRMVTFAPWLTGHGERIDYLVGAQRADGAWGGPGAYALVPTLSATEALLGAALTPRGREGRERLAASAGRGLSAAFGWLNGPASPALPDTPAIELITSSLTDLINAHLERLRSDPPPGLDRFAGSGRLRPPPQADGKVLKSLRARLAAGGRVPQKLMHALEVAGDGAAGAAGATLTPIGSVGASPAATAAWLAGRGEREPGHPARRHLESVVRRHGGPVPCGIPVTVFERGWVLSNLARAGMPLAVPEHVLWTLSAASDPQGTPAGAGLPPDADTTAVALYALALLGRPYDPASLLAYETPTHFCTWQGEEGVSLTVNAHVLDAFGQYCAAEPAALPRYAAQIARISSWLRDRQETTGCWSDRWHASPYYATCCCVLALADFGGERSALAVGRAVAWVLDTQREDGSWGRWSGTPEETAYAMQILLLTRQGRKAAPAAALARGRAFLLAGLDEKGADPALWHDKDLYAPGAIVRAAVLAALYSYDRNSL
ncbi:prenyltransferase/squalene oxidase repeat-containing protein [Spongiactinospora sp. TRM90649]|uniref:prenyltransferase/squalene oxidase repeat-containing protein n=1 Tax=Spongiactinospora sp. TRM90649 TaxID=3031114 RepID=UPI0023F9C7A3|nr:prenyltransferase/squalene oxidase repeat-containing protein [Spongiactinospora sp. TRM90649]MDF5752029.1 prenyltransferase/squalene oxidase repeat-containing protein [Spongiactinospora sp. TRM90649]